MSLNYWEKEWERSNKRTVFFCAVHKARTAKKGEVKISEELGGERVTKKDRIRERTTR